VPISKLAVTFAPRAGAEPIEGEPIVQTIPSLHGRSRDTCRLCGECNVGCNFGSKNTLDHNYLAAAVKAGAEIRTRCEVKEVRPREGGGYLVRYVDHSGAIDDEPAKTKDLPSQTLVAKRVIVSVGSLGSTYLLLAALLALEIFPRPIAATALGFTILGDGVAALAGRAYGKTRLFGKSLEGYGAGLLACVAWAAYVALGGHLPWAVVITGALTASLVELLPIPLDDNLAITLAAGYAMSLLAGH